MIALHLLMFESLTLCSKQIFADSERIYYVSIAHVFTVMPVKHFQSGNLLVKLYLKHFYEHNGKSIGVILETYVPLDLSNICLKHGIQ